MSRFIYMLTEGVHDVAFLVRVLKRCHGATKVDSKAKLDEPRRHWVDSFKWPTGDKIDRLSVPAPIFAHLPASDTLVGLRNAEGITRLKETLEVDLEALYKHNALPEAIGVFLDSDNEPQDTRFKKLRVELQKLSLGNGTLSMPDQLAVIGTENPRVGAFAFPKPGTEGALEDLLLEIGAVPYEELCRRASEYATGWHAHVATDNHKDWGELKGQSGLKKGTFAAATALLKPGRGSVATIEDNRWVGDATEGHAALAPCLTFLKGLLVPPAPTIANAGATP